MTDPLTAAVSLRLDDTPPSTSQVDWWSQRRACTPWREKLANALPSAPRSGFVKGMRAEIGVTFPDRRRRNPELYRPVVVRALGEALVEAGWIGDRGDLTVAFRLADGSGGPSTTIELQSAGAS